MQAAYICLNLQPLQLNSDNANANA